MAAPLRQRKTALYLLAAILMLSSVVFVRGQAHYQPGGYYRQEDFYETDGYDVMYETQHYPPPAQHHQVHKRQTRNHLTLDDAAALSEKGMFLMRDGRYTDAMKCFDAMLRIHLQILGDRHPVVAQTIDMMGCCFLRLGRHADAEEALEKSLEIYALLGQTGRSVDWAMSMMHMGQAHEAEAEMLAPIEGKIPPEVNRLTDKAFEEFQQALEVFNVLEREDPDIDIANIMHCMGNLHNIRHEYVAALRRFKLALADKITILGEESVSVAVTKNNIANALQGMNKIDEAIDVYKEALHTMHRILGPDHPEVAQVHWNLALAYHEKGVQNASKRANSWAGHWLFRLFLGKRGVRRLAHEGSDFQKMDKHVRHAFGIFESVLGEDHYSTQLASQALLALEELKKD